MSGVQVAGCKGFKGQGAKVQCTGCEGHRVHGREQGTGYIPGYFRVFHYIPHCV